MAWYAALFCPPGQQAAIAAVHDIRTAILGVDKAVDEAPARLRLAWWGEELGLLAAGQARHPATRHLLACLHAGDGHGDPETAARLLQELRYAGEDDLAGVGCQNADEFRLYAFRSHGAALAATGYALGLARAAAIDIGRETGLCILAARVLACLGRDLRQGNRLLAPLEQLEAAGLDRGGDAKPDHAALLPVATALATTCRQAASRLDGHLAGHDGETVRYARILARLHLCLCERAQRAWHRRVPSTAITCPPLKQLWLAWRAGLKN
jgi:phytoene synthase